MTSKYQNTTLKTITAKKSNSTFFMVFWTSYRSRKPRPLGHENRAKSPPPGQMFSKILKSMTAKKSNSTFLWFSGLGKDQENPREQP